MYYEILLPNIKFYFDYYCIIFKLIDFAISFLNSGFNRTNQNLDRIIREVFNKNARDWFGLTRSAI